MNLLKTSAIGVLLSLCTIGASAQEKAPHNEPDHSKPRLFDDRPQRMSLRVSDLQPLFNLPTGAPVTAQLAEGFTVEGTVVSKSDARDLSVQTVVVKLTNRPGASFTFTRTKGKDGSPQYMGRILSFRNSDAFEIVREGNGYILQKKSLYDLVAE